LGPGQTATLNQATTLSAVSKILIRPISAIPERQQLLHRFLSIPKQEGWSLHRCFTCLFHYKFTNYSATCEMLIRDKAADLGPFVIPKAGSQSTITDNWLCKTPSLFFLDQTV